MDITQSPANNPVLVFDWGDTVMQVFAGQSGPMESWPAVAAVPGIVDALETLKGRCLMVLASNAEESGSTQVWNALRRAGLADYFQAVFTSRDLGARKPQTAFFRQVETMMGRPSHEMVMIGDSYHGDVLGARQAGWNAVWYNPARAAAPGLVPMADAEIYDLAALPGALEGPFLPGYAQVLAWLVERGTPFNILAHIQLVAAASYQIAAWMNAAGVSLDPLLVHRGAMLHDLAKMDSIVSRRERGEHGDHGRMAYDALMEKGLPALALIADRHMPVDTGQHPRAPQTWEEKIVHYGDKLAEGSRLVTPAERIQALRGRYPDFAAELEASQPYLMEIEGAICAALGETQAGFYERLRKAILGLP